MSLRFLGVRKPSTIERLGVVVGRNVWGRPHPATMIDALRAIVLDRDTAMGLRLAEQELVSA